jgi:hypothetical protein
MSKVPFKDSPFLVKAAVFLGFFTAWVIFEEFVIDRHGLWRFLPFYKVGFFFCLSRRSERAPCVVRRSLRWCPACT